MKKKIAIVVLLIILTGCNQTDKKKETTNSTKIESDAQTLTKEDSKEDASSTQAEKKETSEENKDKNQNEDSSAPILDDLEQLSGEALFAAVMSKEHYPDVYYETTSTLADGTTSVVATYKVGSAMRNEIQSDEGLTIQIFDEEGTMYTYNATTKTGMKSSDDDMDVDMEDSDEDELMMGQGINKAELIDFNGKKTLYVEQDYSDEDLTMSSFSWIDLEFGVVIKSEVYMNDSLSITSEVTKITADFDKNKNLFIPDEDINFIDFASMLDS